MAKGITYQCSLRLLFALTVSSMVLSPWLLSSSALKQCQVSDYIGQTTVGCNYLLIQSQPAAPIANANGTLTLKIGAYYDNLMGPLFHHSTYNITITKISQGNRTIVFHDIIHSHGGLLYLNFQGSNRSAGTKLVGNIVREPSLLNAVIADKGGNVNLTGALPIEPSSYKVQVSLLGVKSDAIQSSSGLLSSEVYLSVGGVYSKNVDYQGRIYNTTITSYVGSINDSNFDANTRAFSWKTPFDWKNIQSGLNDTNVIVHEDIKVPKSLPGFSNYTASFEATVNGVPVKGRMLVVDPYYPETYVIFHFLLTKSNLVKIAERMEAANTTSMKFRIAPSS